MPFLCLQAKRIEEQRKYGVYFDDDYDYMQHMKDLSEVHEWAQVPKVKVSFMEKCS